MWYGGRGRGRGARDRKKGGVTGTHYPGVSYHEDTSRRPLHFSLTPMSLWFTTFHPGTATNILASPSLCHPTADVTLIYNT